jgi:spermidine synthase
MTVRRQAFIVLYAASGAAALVYEITWTRLLTLLMGHTVAATSTVLAAFMGGLAAGSWIGGRLDSRLSRFEHADVARLRAYAALELVVALAAIALPALLAACGPALAWTYHDGLAPVRFGIVRIALSIAVLGLPTMAMGATFPIAAAWYVNAAARLRRAISDEAGDAGALYASNTAGAAVGALAAGLWLVPAVGVRWTTWSGVMLNLASVIGALALARNEVAPAIRRGTSRKRTALPQHVPLPQPAVACAAASICGLVALAYEVAWTRLVTLVVGPTTYAFTIVVTSFIIGIAIGSAAAAQLVRRSRQPAMWLGAMLAITAVAASAASWFAASRLPLIVASQAADPGAAFGRVIVREAAGIALLLLPMTCALGAAFPLAFATASVTRQTAGHDLARVYASNTLGAIGGALIGGFVLLPGIGLHNTFRAAAAISLTGAAGVWTAGFRAWPVMRGRLAATALFAIGVAVTSLLPSWNLGLLAAGAYKYARSIRPRDFETELETWRLLFYDDGAAATVSVRELAGMRSLVIDGKVDASNMGDMLTQRLLGLLPVLLHPDPQEVCVIGLGSGVTAGSALAPGTVRHADIVEISPEVVKASAFFDRENGHVLGAPGVRLIVGDGRSHLRFTKRRYDVIVSEPSNPWMAGVAALFTREFFEEAHACLKPNGLFCQWAHTYDMRPGDLRSIVGTFASVFPQATMWLVGDGDLLLIGTNGPAIDLGGIEQHWRQGSTPALLADVGIDDRAAPFALFSLLAGGPAELKRYAADAAVQRDDRMALEFSAPQAMYERSPAENAATIRQLADPAQVSPSAHAAFEHATDISWTVAGAMEFKANAYGLAYDRFREAVRLNSRNIEALKWLSDAARAAHREEDEQAVLDSLASAQQDNAAVRVELSRLHAASGNTQLAVAMATEAMRLAPNDPAAGEQLASLFAEAGDAEQLRRVADDLTSRFPQHDKSRYYHAIALFLTGRVQEAIDQAKKIAATNPQDVEVQNLLGVACAAAGLRDCALAAFKAAIAANPRDSATYVSLGLFYLESGDPEQAAWYYSVALALDRSSSPAEEGLAKARAALAEKR